MVKKFCPKGTLIFFVRKNLRHIFSPTGSGVHLSLKCYTCVPLGMDGLLR